VRNADPIRGLSWLAFCSGFGFSIR